MQNKENELSLLKEILKKLTELTDVISVQGKEKEDQIKILVNKRYSNGDISDLLGIPKGTVDSIRASFKRRVK